MRSAESIAETLALSSGVRGTLVYGSVARGDATTDSDLDLIVVGDRPELSAREIRRLIPERLRSSKPSVSFYTLEEFDALLSAKASFADHLTSEGRVLFDRDGELRRLLKAHTGITFSVADELDFELRRLRHFENLSQFNGNFLFCLAHLYVIAKAVVMLVLTNEARAEYNKDRAFKALAVTHPELRDDIALLERLKPFYLRVTRGRPEPLPFPYRSADAHVKDAIRAIWRVAALAQ